MCRMSAVCGAGWRRDVPTDMKNKYTSTPRGAEYFPKGLADAVSGFFSPPPHHVPTAHGEAATEVSRRAVYGYTRLYPEIPWQCAAHDIIILCKHNDGGGDSNRFPRKFERNRSTTTVCKLLGTRSVLHVRSFFVEACYSLVALMCLLLIIMIWEQIDQTVYRFSVCFPIIHNWIANLEIARAKQLQIFIYERHWILIIINDD